MSRDITVSLNGESLVVKSGTTLQKIINGKPEFKGTMGALVNQRLMGLYRPLRSDCTVKTVTYTSKEGANIYRRTAALMMCAAFAELYPDIRLVIGQSLARGYYYHDFDQKIITSEMLENVKAHMFELSSAARPIRPTLVATEEAIDYFDEKGYFDKAALLRQRQLAEIPWLILGKFRDISYGPVAPNTDLITSFNLVGKEPGFVLTFPDRRGNLYTELPPHGKLFSTYQETRSWNAMIGIHNVAQLNQACIDGSISDIIKVAEGLQEKKIARLADDITQARHSIRLVLVAGPSSSGKTTFTKRLAVQLKVNGIRPVMLSMDNYYVNRVETPKNPDGSYNFECLEALDVRLFNEHLSLLLNGAEVQTPVFDFVTGVRRSDKYIPLRLDDDQVLIVEGIHGLNPKLSASISTKNKFRIYVSALTQLLIDDHNRIFTSDMRLMRRIVRDRLYRGYLAADTIRQWPSVRAGENEYIFPYQEEADVMFDTALVYEPAVLKPFLRRFLMEVRQDDPTYVEAYRLFNFLGLFIPIFPREVPNNSLLREFIGDSAFDY